MIINENVKTNEIKYLNELLKAWKVEIKQVETDRWIVKVQKKTWYESEDEQISKAFSMARIKAHLEG